jgi:hypothetical protein
MSYPFQVLALLSSLQVQIELEDNVDSTQTVLSLARPVSTYMTR